MIADLRRAGYPLDADWFAPHFEFRFPVYRRASATSGIEMELRQAIEPWYVLGEEAGRRRHRPLCRFLARTPAGSRARPDGRVSCVACNGRRCRCTRPAPRRSSSRACAIAHGNRRAACIPPFRSTRRWSSTSDTWNKRSIGGLPYHVAPSRRARAHDTSLSTPWKPRPAAWQPVFRRGAYAQAKALCRGRKASIESSPYTLDLRRSKDNDVPLIAELA